MLYQHNLRCRAEAFEIYLTRLDNSSHGTGAMGNYARLRSNIGGEFTKIQRVKNRVEGVAEGKNFVKRGINLMWSCEIHLV